MLSPADIESFRSLVDARGFITASDEIAPWLTDWRDRYHGQSPAILAPTSTAQVSAIISQASHKRIALVPQGGNTSMVGGATPPSDGSALILSLRRMNSIRAISATENVAVCEAGVILSTLHDAASHIDRRFPLSLGAKGSATIGGLISTNAGGTQVLRHGTMRNLVAGVEAVLPDGSIYNGLAALKKDNRGYDLKQLLIGAEGTLGVVTAATLKLAPGIGDSAVAWVGVDSPHAALSLLRFLEGRIGPMVEGFEVLPDDMLRAVLRHVPGTRAPIEAASKWHVLIEVDLDMGKQGAAAMLEAALAAFFETGRGVDAVIAASEAQAQQFWRIRESISEAERALGPALQFDVSVPVGAMPDFMVDTALATQRAFPGTSAGSFGHLGDGNVHFHVRAPAGTPDGAAWRTENTNKISAFVHDAVTERGGSISAEHGIGQMKRAEFARLASPAHLGALKAIKSALDPYGIMNPGKLIPLASDD